jgi:hypothetical protein
MATDIQVIELDAKARALVKAYVDAGTGNWTEAVLNSSSYARKEHKSVAERASQSPAILAAVHVEIGRRLIAGAPIALKVLQDICKDGQAPAKLRLEAAKTLLDRSGHIAPKARDSGNDATKQAHEMSLDELKNTRAALEREIQARATPLNAPDGMPDDSQVTDLLE